MHKLLAIAFLSLCPLAGWASIEVTSHSYVHQPSGEPHVVLHLANYKRGLFFGSCGPSSRSLQWEYTIELTGEGPGYRREAIEIKDGNFKVLSLDSGQIQMDAKKRRVSIKVNIQQIAGPTAFPGNGNFKLKQKS